MKKRFTVFISLLCVCALAVSATMLSAGAAGNTIPEDEISAIVNTATDTSKISSPFTEAVTQVRDSVVGINNYQRISPNSFGYGFGFGYGYDGRGRGEETEQLAATGSGVVITSYGHVLTNYHVIEGAARVTVTDFADNSEHEATVAGYDADLDIAVLQVDGLGLKPVALGDSDSLQVGEWAIVIGNPLSQLFERTVTVGVVSAVDRQVTDTSYDRYYRRYTTTNTMIQVDAAINSGNSGGGMFNVLGQLQGIPARKYSSNSSFFSSSADVDNIGLCIPINVAKPLIEEVLRGYNGTGAPAERSAGNGDSSTNNSMIDKPRLGVTVSTLSSSVTAKLPLGAIIISVDANSPAEEAGLQKGDVIVEVNGTPTSSSSAVIGQIQDLKEGDQVQVKVYRAQGVAEAIGENALDLNSIGDGEYLDFTVTLRVVGAQSSMLLPGTETVY